MPHLYGPVPDVLTCGKIGVIVATEPRGPLANLIYCSNDQPLYMVPRYLYAPVPKSEDAAREGRSSIKYKRDLNIGDQVEFELDKNRLNTVLWMMKSPDYLPIDCRSGGSPRMEVIAIVTTVEDDPFGLVLWNPRYKYIEATGEQLRSQPLGVPLWCCIEIIISYGQYEGAMSIPLDRDFNPSFWFRLVDFLNKPVDPIEGQEVLKEAPRVTAMLKGNSEEVRSAFDYSQLETIFDRASKVRKRSSKKMEVPTKADAGSVDKGGGEDDPVDEELTAMMKKILSIG